LAPGRDGGGGNGNAPLGGVDAGRSMFAVLVPKVGRGLDSASV
jgi:hypothetical protein